MSTHPSGRFSSGLSLIRIPFLNFTMSKCKKKNAKKGANSGQTYDIQAAPLVDSRERSQETENISSQGSQTESFSCDKCSKSTDHLLQCEYCTSWFCNVSCNIHDNLLNSLGDYKNLHWYCNTCDVIVSELIAKSSLSGVVPSILSETINTAIHKSLDKAIGGIVKVLTEKTNELQDSLRQATQLTDDDHMEVSNRDRPSVSSPPFETQHQSSVDVIDEYMERERRKNNLISIISQNPLLLHRIHVMILRLSQN